MTLFHSAVVVVAPHGAGLSNVLFSRPGTFVVEGVCNVPHVNLCFQRLTHVLGHHWHGVTSRGGYERDSPSEYIAGTASRPVAAERERQSLGVHRWHGVTSRGGCETVVDVAASDVDAYVKQYLHLWKSSQ